MLNFARAATLLLIATAPSLRAEFVFSCVSNNDLYQMVARSGTPTHRFDTPADAIAHTGDGGALLILADRYPETLKDIPASVFNDARARHVHLYVEFASAVPGLKLGEVRGTTWERAVVASDVFGKDL